MNREERKNYIKEHADCVAVSIGISVIFLLFGIFRFNGFVGRIIESLRDVGTSFVYFICDIFEIQTDILPTVNDYPVIPFFGFLYGESAPEIPIPKELQEFAEKWQIYWSVWATWENFQNYLSSLGNIMVVLSKALVFVLPVFFIVKISFDGSVNKQNNDYNKDSKPFKIYKRVLDKTFRPVKHWILRYRDFWATFRIITRVWLITWLCYFNVFTIILEVVAYYLYFIVSFDVLSLYRQAYKLLLDLWAFLTFFPVWLYPVVVVTALCKKSYSVGYDRLRHNEACNCGVVKERGVVTIVYGEMGAGKTALITDMTLSENNILRDQAFEIILESDMMFPNFPWIVLENELKRCFAYHKVYSILTCKRWVAKKKARFEKKPGKKKIFDYDYERYATEYDDKLKIWNIWEVIEQYACAYLIYTVQTSYVISSYSIRTDVICNDIGNFPLYNKDFFARDTRLQESFSRHSHILDFDMLRLGKVMLDNNPLRKSFGFGVYVISEIDKERKNSIELQEIKRKDEECNQKNDLFNTLIKLSRHQCVIANRVFVKVFADLQRPSSLGADARELGEVMRIVEQPSIEPLLPVYSPFWVFEWVYARLSDKFNSMYVQYRYSRGDNTLFMHVIKNIMALLSKHYRAVRNTFGCSAMTVSLESGTLDGVRMERRWYKMPKKIYSERYCTDCFSSIFDKRAEDNVFGIDDIPEYESGRATWAELQSQHSFLQRDLETIASVFYVPDKKTDEQKHAAAVESLGYDVDELLKQYT